MKTKQDHSVTDGKTIYISDDGKIRSTNKQKVEDYENLLSFIGAVSDYRIGFLDYHAALPSFDTIGDFIFEAKTKQQFLSLVSALRRARRGWSNQDNDFLSELFDKEANPTLKFTCTNIFVEEEDEWECQLDVITLNQLAEECDWRIEGINKVKERIATLQGN